jgi:hypothetical protein
MAGPGPNWRKLATELEQLRALRVEVLVYLEMFDAAVDGERYGGRPITGDDLTYALGRVRAAVPNPPPPRPSRRPL